MILFIVLEKLVVLFCLNGKLGMFKLRFRQNGLTKVKTNNENFKTILPKTIHTHKLPIHMVIII